MKRCKTACITVYYLQTALSSTTFNNVLLHSFIFLFEAGGKSSSVMTLMQGKLPRHLGMCLQSRCIHQQRFTLGQYDIVHPVMSLCRNTARDAFAAVIFCSKYCFSRLNTDHFCRLTLSVFHPTQTTRSTIRTTPTLPLGACLPFSLVVFYAVFRVGFFLSGDTL